MLIGNDENLRMMTVVMTTKMNDHYRLETEKMRMMMMMMMMMIPDRVMTDRSSTIIT